MEPKGEVEFWEEFKSAPEDIAFESEQIKASFLNTSVEELNQIKERAMSKEGKERLTLVKARVNQNIFRKRILSAYNYKCCITGLNIPSLLVAGHIVPWSIDKENRLNPKNGLCINRIHDRLFEDGTMWIDESYKIHFSEKLDLESPENEWVKKASQKNLLKNDFTPDSFFLKKHAERHGHLLS